MPINKGKSLQHFIVQPVQFTKSNGIISVLGLHLFLGEYYFLLYGFAKKEYASESLSRDECFKELGSKTFNLLFTVYFWEKQYSSILQIVQLTLNVFAVGDNGGATVCLTTFFSFPHVSTKRKESHFFFKAK